MISNIISSYIAFACCLSICSFYVGYFGSSNQGFSSRSFVRPSQNQTARELTFPLNTTLDCLEDFFSSEKNSRDVRGFVTSQVLNRLYSLKTNTNISVITPLLFPTTTFKYASGAIRVPKDALFEAYDFGVPTSLKTLTNSEALIIYNTPRSLPEDWNLRHESLFGKYEIESNGEATHLSGSTLNISSSLVNCDTLNIIFSDAGHNRPGASKTCLAIVGNFENYHKDRWLRIPYPPKDGYKDYRRIPLLDPSSPLRHVGRVVMEDDGVDEFATPPISSTSGKIYEQHWQRLHTFFENLDTVLDELKTVVDPIAKSKTVIVMTVNAGQSELLGNFVCAARSRGLDIENVLVFPTDLETKQLAEGFGLKTYFDKRNLGSLPKQEAANYGDSVFGSMMFAKILCVLYVNLLGYNFVFQDVDVVWFKNPLEFFQKSSSAKFDVLFQHDGSPQPRYAPYSANSGFYYMKSNERTTYLLVSLLYHADLVASTGSHQQVLVQLLSEHSSLFGLKVKVFDKTLTSMFPGGYHFHREASVMKDIVTGKSDAAFIFHMSWTENKKNKLLFFRQLGEWYLHDKCVGKPVDELIGDEIISGNNLLSKHCCSVTPLVTCHFRDKPSKIPCPDSPMMDSSGVSFW